MGFHLHSATGRAHLFSLQTSALSSLQPPAASPLFQKNNNQNITRIFLIERNFQLLNEKIFMLLALPSEVCNRRNDATIAVKAKKVVFTLAPVLYNIEAQSVYPFFVAEPSGV